MDLRILIVAEHTSARFGGEAAIPLHLFRQLRLRGMEVWLVTHARTRAELRELFPDDGDRIFYVPDTSLHRWLDRIGKAMHQRVAYFTTGTVSRLFSQFVARRIARRLVAEHRIDVVHQPIPVSPREFSVLYKMGAPVVIGPMNGGMAYPPGFRSRESACVRLFVRVGRLVSNTLNRLLPGKLRADVLLVANERTHAALPAHAQGRVLTLVDNGVDMSLWQAADSRARSSCHTTRFVFVGRLIDLKGLDLLLVALKIATAQADVRLEIIGGGPSREGLLAQTVTLGLMDRVNFRGWLPQQACVTRLRNADVLVLPSLHECGGAVVLEAMAIGMPVIATDWGGPADYIDPSCGILVGPSSREAFIAGLTAAMLTLAGDPDLRQRMGAAGREKVLREYDWERKVDRLIKIYEDAIERRASAKPTLLHA